MLNDLHEISLNIDLHRHLDGNIRPSSIWSLAQQHNIDIGFETREALLAHFHQPQLHADLIGFLSQLDLGVSVLANEEAIYRIAYENVEDLLNESIDYAELRYSPYYMAMHHQLPMQAVIQAVTQGVKDASAEQALKVNLIGILSRTFGAEQCMHELSAILAERESFVALDLAGDERGFPAVDFRTHFAQAREQGLAITVHAGEADGAQSVWSALHDLGASRIGHGIRSIEDPRLIDYLVEHRIGLECCLTSNVHTGVWPDLTTHPVKAMLERGVAVTLNTDDPGVSGNTLKDEFELAATYLGMGSQQQLMLRNNALHQAFMTASEKQALLVQKKD